MTSYIEKTQADLGAVISSPKLSEKLLSKPPFRFLHDVVTSFLKTTGFPDGLYSDDMLDSSKVTEKDSKMEFLRLLISAIEAGTGSTCAAKPAKIIAGQEPENTNQMLQLLAACASLSKEKKESAVKKAKGGDDRKEKPKETEEERQKRKEEERRKRKEEEEKKTEKPKETEEERQKRKEEERLKRKEEEEKKTEKPKETEEERQKRKEEERRKRKEEEEKKTEKPKETEEERQKRKEEERRKRKEEDRRREKDKERDKEAQRNLEHASNPNGVIREARRDEAAEREEKDEEDWQKIAEKYESRPTAGVANNADESDVKGALGKQALKAKREQEEIQRKAEEVSSAPREGGIVIRSKGQKLGSNVIGENELSRLREQLQMLTKASSPLGKFLEAIYDDIDSMIRELEMWRSESRNQALGAAEARRQTEDSLKEVHAQLQTLEDAINDQILKTNHLRQHIIANDGAMEGMIRMIVNPEVGMN